MVSAITVVNTAIGFACLQALEYVVESCSVIASVYYNCNPMSFLTYIATMICFNVIVSIMNVTGHQSHNNTLAIEDDNV